MECERPHSDILRQGDIFAAHPGTANWQDPHRRFGVVLSADCDLAHQRTGPNLIYAPIMGLHNYVATSWLPAQFSKLHSTGLRRLAKLIQQLSLTQHTADALIKTDNTSFNRIINQLEAKTETDIEKLVNGLTTLRQDLIKAQSVIDEYQRIGSPFLSVEAALHAFYELDESINNLAADTTRRRNQLHNFLQSLADKDRLDTWPLCDLVGLDGDMRDEEPHGFVVSLRQFSVLPVTLISTRRTDWQNDPSRFIRICRLRGIYKTDLLQRFSNLFIRVGLEDERIDFHKRMFQRTARKLIPEDIR